MIQVSLISPYQVAGGARGVRAGLREPRSREADCRGRGPGRDEEGHRG